jgi:CRP/FNR family cyclic AMP-dependent transcriptional regulator
MPSAMSATDFAAAALRDVTQTLGTPLGVVAVVSAVVAAGLVIASSFAKTMIPLRWLAAGGNAGFLVYGLLHPSLVMVLLHGVLLPFNVWRALDMTRLVKRVRTAAAEADLSGVWLKPYMKKRAFRSGDVVFRQGDAADRLYFLAEGRIEWVEIGETMEAGRLFGEIAFFAPDNRRTLTARCASDCTVLSIDGDSFRQLYFQNPAFGFRIVSLVAGRLIADRRRIEQRHAYDAAHQTGREVP